jgi:hypothetical protein
LPAHLHCDFVSKRALLQRDHRFLQLRTHKHAYNSHAYAAERQVNLSLCRNLTDAAIVSLAVQCPRLTEIDFSNCHQLTSTAVMILAEHCPRLVRTVQHPCHLLLVNT